MSNFPRILDRYYGNKRWLFIGVVTNYSGMVWLDAPPAPTQAELDALQPALDADDIDRDAQITNALAILAKARDVGLSGMTAEERDFFVKVVGRVLLKIVRFLFF